MESKKTWILDIVIKDGDFYWMNREVDSGMWLVVSCDGSSQPISTNQVPYSPNPHWEFAFRMCLQLTDIGMSYLYLTLCTFHSNGNNIYPIARARIGLYNMPIGNPKQFSFPLYHDQNSAYKVINIRAVATLSTISTNIPTFDDFLPQPAANNFSVDNFPVFM